MSKRSHLTILFSAVLILISLNIFSIACARGNPALDTTAPVSKYFDELTALEVIAPDLNSIDQSKGTIIKWKVMDPGLGDYVDFSWVLAKNTDDLKKAMIFFDSAQSWNTGDYVFLPVTNPALEVHKSVGLEVPKSIYDEDGMDRIREIVLSGKAPEGSFVDQFDQFMGD